jgi:pilus assembly protein CpaC
VPAGQSALVRLRRPAERVAIADPEVADVVMVNPREILINGRGRRFTATSGEPIILEAQTSLIVWDRDGRADVRSLYVNRSRPEQIELRVTVAELNRTAMENQGVDFKVFQSKVLISSTPAKLATLDGFLSSLTSPVPGGPATVTEDLALAQDRITFSVLDLQNNFLAFVELLQREALAKILARPTLLSRSGEEAHFRSGGEVPIPLVTNDQLAVQFKEFGAIVTFTPVFTEDGQIDLRVVAELSQPDFTLSRVQAGGFVVPAFLSRQARTRVRLNDGQSLLIAGLLRDDETEEERKVPYLGDVPYLGFFFRATSFEHTRSELLILVQPRVISGDEDVTERPLPTDRPPLGRSETRTQQSPNEVGRPRLLPNL